jgi:Transport and Golgi organisation 2
LSKKAILVNSIIEVKDCRMARLFPASFEVAMTHDSIVLHTFSGNSVDWQFHETSGGERENCWLAILIAVIMCS